MDIANIHCEANESIQEISTSHAIKNVRNVPQNFMEEEDFLKQHGFERCIEAFMEEEVRLEFMGRLTSEDLTTLGIHTIGARVRFRDAVATWELNEKKQTTSEILTSPKPVLEELSAKTLDQNLLVTVENK